MSERGMINCPECNSTRYKEGPLGKVCKKCGFRNDPNYLRRKNDKNNNRQKDALC